MADSFNTGDQGGSTPGTGATNLGKAEDAAHASGDTGVAAWAVRKDTAAATAADGDYHPLEVDSTGRLYANVTNTVSASLVPATSGGSSIYRNLDAGTTGAVVKASAGQIYGWFLSNNAATARFVKIYDKASAPTQADTPVLTLQLPASSAANVAFPNGVAFANGISIRASTGVADNDTGATTTNDVIVNLNYK